MSGILIIYALLSLYQINLPGLHYDEAFEAVPALQLLLGQPVTTFRNSGFILAGQRFPLMTQDYIGALNTYLAIPFIAIFGSTPVALRVLSILVGAITLWLAFALGCTLTGSGRVGLVAAMLLAVDPTFIFWNRQGIFVTAVTAAIGLAATLCWLRRAQGASARWTMAGAFLFGLGLYAKLLFLWLIAALVGAVVLLNLPDLIKRGTKLTYLRQVRQGEVAGAALAFLAGCWPLIAYNLQSRGTLLSIAQNAATSYYGVNNLAFGQNLITRLDQFIVMLNGSHLWYLGDIIGNPLPALTFGIILGAVVIVALTTRIKPGAGSKAASQLARRWKVAAFPFLVIGLVILASIGTVSALWVTHFAILMPWPAIALAVGGWFVLSQLIQATPSFLSPSPGPRPLSTTFRQWAAGAVRGLTWLGLGLIVGTNLLSVIGYHQALTKSGGLSSHSDAIYDLSDWLATQAHGPIVMMDWGLAAPVIYLTHGQVQATEVFGYAWEPDLELAPRLQSFIAQPATLYLWRAPDEIIFDRSQEFKALYRPLNLEETIEAAFYERSGRPVLGVTRLVPKGTAENPPK